MGIKLDIHGQVNQMSKSVPVHVTPPLAAFPFLQSDPANLILLKIVYKVFYAPSQKSCLTQGGGTGGARGAPPIYWAERAKIRLEFCLF